MNGLKKPAIVYGAAGLGGLGALVEITEEVEGRYFAKYISQAILVDGTSSVEWKHSSPKLPGSMDETHNAEGVRDTLEETERLKGQLWYIY